MTHRDRVLAALNGETTDRCPMQISFTPEFAARLRAESGEQSERVHNPHGGANTYELERMLDQGGGLILGPTHHVQLDTPLENFWAMVDTIKNPQA